MNNDPIIFEDLAFPKLSLTVEIRNQVEVCQGGPSIGKLFVNNIPLFENEYFGGPMLIEGRKLFLPKRKRSFFFNGFGLCVVDLETEKLIETPLREGVLWLSHISDEQLFYYNDLFEKKLLCTTIKSYL